MATLSKYKHLLAALLLLLYVFIATPVHWWHQHKQGNASARIAFTSCNDNNTLTPDTGKSYSGHCTICSHHYSVYAVTETWWPQTLITLHGSCYPGYMETTADSLVFLYSNKGPPSLLS